MKKISLALAAFVLFSSHVMYLKLDSYFLEPNASVTIQLFNGTFDKSENVIDRDRMLDASLLQNGQRIKVDDSQWTEKDSVTLLNFQTGEEGTYVAGISTAPRSIEMDAEAFNTYLEHEGILDMITARKKNAGIDSAAVEKYSKHVKTIFQVGDKKTNDWQTILGYPIEFVPLQNPYDLNTGDELQVKLLRNGKPLANQLVYADFKAAENGHTHDEEAEHGHSHDEKATASHSHDGGKEHSHEQNSAQHSHDEGVESHTHTSGQQLRSDDNGVVTAKLTADGIWYLQTIHLVHTKEEGFTHESNWTTLTFEVVHGHGEETHTHEHEHEHEDGIPSWAYWAGSLFLVGILFFWFNRKKD